MNDNQKLEFNTQLEDKTVEIATLTNSLNELESKYEVNLNNLHSSIIARYHLTS